VPHEVIAKLRLQVLVYSEVPSERLVFINNQKYVEGQRIDADLVIERITSDGAVLSYQGKRLVLARISLRLVTDCFPFPPNGPLTALTRAAHLVALGCNTQSSR
jgi:hypothetical protein